VHHTRGHPGGATGRRVWLRSQGAIAGRVHERLATSDGAIVMFRRMLKRQIGKVQQGLEPIGVFRDPEHEIIYTKFEHAIETLEPSAPR